MQIKWLIFILIIFFCNTLTFSQSSNQYPAYKYFSYQNSNSGTLIGNYVYILKDSVHEFEALHLNNINNFIPSGTEIITRAYQDSPLWLYFRLQNKSSSDIIVLEILNSTLDSVSIYEIIDNKLELIDTQGDWVKNDDYVFNRNPSFNLELKPNGIRDLVLRSKSKENISVPIRLNSVENHSIERIKSIIIYSFYFGIILVMFLYNLFLYLTIKDKSYLFYIIYILSFGIVQASLGNFTQHYIWPDSIFINHFSIVFFSSTAGIFAIKFTQYFLDLKINAPRINKGLYLFTLIYILIPITYMIGFMKISYMLLDFAGLSVAMYALWFAILLSIKGIRAAKFFLIAWISFIIGLIVFIFKNLGILPLNNITENALLFGSGFETILLSIALADRINILKKEKAESQAESLKVLEENQRIISEQNVFLETKVTERTEELNKVNNDLKLTLTNLQEAQTQLVESEKMASLGQLTAGVAHEINNPINFVSSNVNPLKRDIGDLIKIIEEFEEMAPSELKQKINELKDEIEYEIVKDEINMLLKGIEEGASRTVEIVKSLRNFSRLDEQEFKTAQINEGIESTLILLGSSMGDTLDLIKELGPITEIECFPGKLNQVFMNLISNSIHAVKSKFGQQKGGHIIIRTKETQAEIVIEIEDNGPGIPDQIRDQIFNPFFTTKPSGEGTGLGLSIVNNIINIHHGKIQVESNPGEYTKFIIRLPKYSVNE